MISPLLAALTSLSLVAPCTPERSTLPETPLRTALERANSGELAAVQRGDARAAAAAYTTDALLLPPDGSLVRGRAAIEQFWDAGKGTEITMVTTVTESVGGAGTAGWLAGRYCLVSRPRGSQAAPTTARGTFLLVFRYDGTAWRISHDAWSASS